MSTTSSMGYVGYGRKFTHIETESVRAVSGGVADLVLDGESKSVVILSKESDPSAIQLNATGVNGGIDIDSGTGGLTIDSTGVIDIGANTAAGNITVGGDATARTITIGNVSGTIALDAGSGGIKLDSVLGDVVLESSKAAVDAIKLNASNAAGGVDIDAGTGGITIDSTGVIGIGVDADNANVNVGTAGTRDVTVGSSASTSRTTILSGSVGTLINSDGDITLTPGGGKQTIIKASRFEGDSISGAGIVLGPADSGQTFSITPSGSGNTSVTLPITKAGLHFRFVLIAPTSGFDVIITASGSHMFGMRSDNTGLPNNIAFGPITSITFDDSAGAASAGDYVELWGIDDTHWFAKVVIASTAAASLVLTT